MDRNQSKDLFRKDKDAYGKPKSVMKKIDLIYDDFEKETTSLIERLDELIKACDDQADDFNKRKMEISECSSLTMAHAYRTVKEMIFNK